MDQELFSDSSDVSVGDAVDVRRDGDTLASPSETAAAPTAHVPVQNRHQNQNQNLHIHRATEYRCILTTDFYTFLAVKLEKQTFIK